MVIPLLPLLLPNQDLDKAVKAIYDVISGPAGQKRNWAEFRDQFTTDGRMMAIIKDRNGKQRQIRISVEDYISQSGPYLEKEGFFEKEISKRQEIYGDMAHVWTTYESRNTPDGKVIERGINSIQFVRIDGKWKVDSLTWVGETKELPLPKEYLKK